MHPYAEFIALQLAQENNRQTVLEDKGNRLTQTSAVTAVLFATASGLLLGKDVRPTGPALVMMCIALGLFLAAVVCGVIVGRPAKQTLATASTLDAMVAKQWDDPESQSQRVIASLNVDSLGSLRPSNAKKVPWLVAGLVLQSAALLAAAVCLVQLAALA